jgi:hypothetical protein
VGWHGDARQVAVPTHLVGTLHIHDVSREVVRSEIAPVLTART